MTPARAIAAGITTAIASAALWVFAGGRIDTPQVFTGGRNSTPWWRRMPR